MARGYYDPARSKIDPLVPSHLKIPTSTLRIAARAASKLGRDRSWVLREWLMAAAEKWLAARERAEEREDDERDEVAQVNGRKRGRQS